MVKTYVVNLKRSPDRRRHIIAECERHGLNFEIVDAIDGLSLSEKELESVIDKEAVGQNPRYFSKGMLACSLSHLRVYEKFLNDGGDAAFVIEDDIGFDPEVAALIETTAPELSCSEVALLFYLSRDLLELSEQNAVELIQDRKLLYPMTLAWVGSTGAYLITREGARKMVDKLLPLKTAPDGWCFFIELGWLDRVRMVYPMPTRALPFKSDIHREGQSKIRIFVTEMIDKYNIPLISAFLKGYRSRNVESMASFIVTGDRSPLDIS